MISTQAEATGAPLWFVDGGPYTSVVATNDAVVATDNAATDGVVVVGSNGGEVRMLDAATGVERWRADHAGEVRGAGTEGAWPRSASSPRVRVRVRARARAWVRVRVRLG